MALAQGTDLSDSESSPSAEEDALVYGTPGAYLLKANLRVSGGEFEKTVPG